MTNRDSPAPIRHQAEIDEVVEMSTAVGTDSSEPGTDEETPSAIKVLSPRRIQIRRFRQNRLAVVGLVVLIGLYAGALFAGFLAPQVPNHRFVDYIYTPPRQIHIRDQEGDWQMPFVYGIEQIIDREKFQRIYIEDQTVTYPVQL